MSSKLRFKKKLSNIIIISICIVLLCPMLQAFAASTTLLTYSGKGIRGKDSVNTFSLTKNTDIKITHNTTGWVGIDGRNKDDLYVKISVKEKGLLFYNETGNSFKVYGIGKRTKTFTEGKGFFGKHQRKCKKIAVYNWFFI